MSRFGFWLRQFKWNRQRKKGKLPECDCWDYKYTLASNIYQGISYLIDKKVTTDKKFMKELEFVKEWARDFPSYESAIIVSDEEELKKTVAEFEHLVPVFTVEQAKEYQKRTERAFRILAKNIHGLWD